MRKFALLLAIAAFSVSAFQPSAFGSDLSITAASVQASNAPGCKVVTGTAGAALTAGQWVYFDGTSNTYKLAGCASSTTAGVAGVALQTVGSGQRVDVCVADQKLTVGATLVIGDTIWLSANAGNITKTQGDIATSGNYISVLGVAVSTSQIALNITSAGAAKP